MALSDLPPLTEQSHGKERLALVRPSDLGTVPTGDDRSRDHTMAGTFAPGNKAAVGRSAKSALRAPYRAAEKRLSEALAGNVEPSEADRLLTDALAVYQAASRELGIGSAFVQGPTIAYSVETILAGHYMQAAAVAGFLTDRGMQLHDKAQACEQAAARAMTAALAATKALSGRKGRSDPHKAVLEAFGEPTKGAS